MSIGVILLIAGAVGLLAIIFSSSRQQREKEETKQRYDDELASLKNIIKTANEFEEKQTEEFDEKVMKDYFERTNEFPLTISYVQKFDYPAKSIHYLAKDNKLIIDGKSYSTEKIVGFSVEDKGDNPASTTDVGHDYFVNINLDDVVQPLISVHIGILQKPVRQLVEVLKTISEH